MVNDELAAKDENALAAELADEHVGAGFSAAVATAAARLNGKSFAKHKGKCVVSNGKRKRPSGCINDDLDIYLEKGTIAGLDDGVWCNRATLPPSQLLRICRYCEVAMSIVSPSEMVFDLARQHTFAPTARMLLVHLMVAAKQVILGLIYNGFDPCS